MQFTIEQHTLRKHYVNDVTRVSFPAGAIVWRVVPPAGVIYRGGPFRSRELAARCAARLNETYGRLIETAVTTKRHKITSLSKPDSNVRLFF